MNTEFPSIELHFVFALTYCKLRVYKSEEVFARTLLQNLKVEMVGDSDSTFPIVGQEFQPMDTRYKIQDTD